MPLVQVSSASIQTTRIDEILVSNSNLLSGLSEASGVKLSWVEVSQESLKNFKASLEGEQMFCYASGASFECYSWQLHLTTRIDEILVSNSSLVSGLPEASGARLSWVEVSQESLQKLPTVIIRLLFPPPAA